MAQDATLRPPAITQIKDDEQASGGASRVPMERSTTGDIQKEKEDLREAAETLNVILDLDCDGIIRWTSPMWEELTGTSCDSVAGKAIDSILQDDCKDVFANAIRQLREDVSGSKTIHFALRVPEPSSSSPEEAPQQTPEAEDEEKPEAEERIVDVEAQGIIIYDRGTGEESHTMWMIRPAIQREVTIDLPEILVDSLGDGAEMLAHHLTRLAEVGTLDPEHNPPPLPVLCRICERQITPWWFPKHSELCLQEHQAEAELQMAQEQLTEHRGAIVGVLDALEAQTRQRSLTPPEGVVSPAPQPEYKGMPIGSSTSSQSSGRASPALSSQPGSRERSSSGLSHHRARSFAVRRPLARIVELILDLCDTALEISQPSLKDTRGQEEGEIRTQSPQSEGRISQVLQWQSPSASTLDQESGLAALCDDSANLAKAKVDCVLRFRSILEYSERIRMEYTSLVQDCIDAAMQKAARINAGEISSSESGDESAEHDDIVEPEPARRPSLPFNQTILLPHPLQQITSTDELSPGSPGISQREAESSRSRTPVVQDGRNSAMALALREASSGTRSPSPAQSPARRLSSAVSTRSSSPRFRAQSQLAAPLASNLSLDAAALAESDAGVDSDSSVRSSVRSLPRQTRSPSVEQSLQRVATSRERKRTSLVLPPRPRSTTRPELPNLPAPQAISPLRIPKPRLPSGTLERSPITSPTLANSEFCSPEIPPAVAHHRRQSSAASSELSRAALSPRLSFAHPPPRAVPPSIKDFEIIKPISKGAFGSVYLAKKKSTGDYYAIKALRKQDMVAKNQVANVKAERAILMFQGESDFVAKLYWTFPSKDYIFLVMEYLNGGDCASLVQSLGALPEDWAKRYLAEVVRGVEHLHSLSIVHRDLKPDNLLIDQKGHLKLTDFGLSRMGLIGRQKRALSSKANDAAAPPDPLKQGSFHRSVSMASSRSASFDIQGYNSPGNTPLLGPAHLGGEGLQPSYFTLGRDLSEGRDRQTSGQRSSHGDLDQLQSSFRRFSIFDSISQDGRSSPKDVFMRPSEPGESDRLHTTISNSSNPKVTTPPQTSSTAMPPPPMTLFDPDDQNRRFVGTPDYLAPETINGLGQDEMSDWWSLGCILFEFLFGYPPFHADTPDQVFEKILNRKIDWPEEEDDEVSAEARDLINRLICLDPSERLGANIGEKYASGGEEIRSHPWFSDVDWEKLNETEPSFVPAPENVEDTEYFDARGATAQDFTTEFDDQATSPAVTPMADFERPHDALSKVRSQINSINRGLMPLHIPPHVRDPRTRRQSEPVAADDFGQFSFKNLPVLEKANKDVIQKLRAEAMQAQSRSSQGIPNNGSSVSSTSPPSQEGSPVIGLPLRRALSTNRGNHRSASPSTLSHTNSSPSRASQPSSPLVHFSTGNHERRKTSSGSSGGHASTVSQPSNFFEIPRLQTYTSQPPMVLSPNKNGRPTQMSMESALSTGPNSPRTRSHTIGSSESEGVVKERVAHHQKRKSHAQAIDISPSSSDTEDPRQKALLRVQRRRQSSRRLSQINLGDGPVFRPLDILIVEDHPVSRLVMERLFGKLRCRSIIVQDGAEAVRYAMSSVKFDIIMTEYRLPQVNGADLARMLRETKNANSHTPIVAVTGYLKDLQAPHHFDALIEKPPTMGKLTEVLSRLCQWKPPPPGWTGSQTSMPQSQPPLPASSLRKESVVAEESPTSTSSSYPSSFPSLSYRGSSRQDSMSSASVWTDPDSRSDDATLSLKRPESEWREAGLGGLGISGNVAPKSSPAAGLSHIVPVIAHRDSAPAAMESGSRGARTMPSPEFVESKRKMRADQEGPDNGDADGDDEDEELRVGRARSKSPSQVSGIKSNTTSPRKAPYSSKLSTEMVRANSHGSVISPGGTLRSSSPTQPPEVSIAEAEEPRSGLTPPEIFPLEPGSQVKEFDMDRSLSSQNLDVVRPNVDAGAATDQDTESTPVLARSPAADD